LVGDSGPSEKGLLHQERLSSDGMRSEKRSQRVEERLIDSEEIIYWDAGVLIASARGEDAPSMSALEILDDQSREFVSSLFIELEVLPKAIYNGKRDEVFYNNICICY
jgi:hypothetical protein